MLDAARQEAAMENSIASVKKNAPEIVAAFCIGGD